MRLYLDDLRPCPSGWKLARNVREAKWLIEDCLVRGEELEAFDLDHDLGIFYCHSCSFSNSEQACLNSDYESICGCDCHVLEPSGYDFLKWIHERDLWPTIKPTVHSANPIGAALMRNFINDMGPYEK